MISPDKERFAKRVYIPTEQQNLIQKIHQYETIHEQIDFAYGIKKLKPSKSSNKNYFIRLINKGEGVLNLGGKDIMLRPGSIILLNPEQKHYIRMNEKLEIDTYTIAFTDQFISEVFKALKEKDERLLDNPYLDGLTEVEFKQQIIGNQPHIGSLIKQTIKETSDMFAQSFARELFMQQILYYVFNIEFREYIRFQNEGNKSTTVRNEIKNRIQMALDFLHSNYKEKISVKELAQIAGLSEAHFIRLFKEILGYSPYQYLVITRLEKAKELLQDSNLNITEIAFDLGYTTVASFTKAFKNYTGVSPTEFKG